MTEECERESVSLNIKGDMIGVAVICNLPTMIRLIFVFVVKLSLSHLRAINIILDFR